MIAHPLILEKDGEKVGGEVLSFTEASIIT